MGTNDERREVVERLRVYHEVAQLSPLDQDAHYQKHTKLLPPEVAELMFYGERKKLIGALIHHKLLKKDAKEKSKGKIPKWQRRADNEAQRNLSKQAVLAYESEIRGAKEAEECALYNSTDNNTTDQKKYVEKPQEKRERRRGQKTLADFENSNESSTYFAKLPMTEVLDARNNLVPRSELNLILFVCFFVQKIYPSF